MTTNRKRQGTKTIAISSLISAVLIAGSMVLPGYSAQDTITPVVAAGATADSSFADLIAQAQPSVVTVEVKKIVKRELSSFNGDPRTEEFFERFFEPSFIYRRLFRCCTKFWCNFGCKSIRISFNFLYIRYNS